jgi:hypothetical protein
VVSKLLGERVVRQVTGRVAGTVASYIKPSMTKLWASQQRLLSRDSLVTNDLL